MTKEIYNINVEIRDKNHKMFQYPTGGGVGDLKFLWEVRDEKHLEHLMQDMHKKLSIIMPENKINIEALVFNSISDTYMVMYSYYGSEQRFVKH